MTTMLRRSFLAALLLFLCTLSHAAPLSGQTPQTGEIALTGSVTKTDSAAHTMQIAAKSVSLPDGTTTNFLSSRSKTIFLTSQTRIVTPEQVTKILADLAAGTSVIVIGTDSGVGQPLTAPPSPDCRWRRCQREGPT